jgi:hypothetical protein
MIRAKLLSVSVALATLALGGCVTNPVNSQSSLHRNQVVSVTTEHSLALSCLGQLIDASGKPRLTVYIDDIRDETVPRSFEDKRLSSGGAWWMHTAINKLESSRVISNTDRTARASGKQNHIVLTGAWTQDDGQVGSRNFDIGGRQQGDRTRTELGFGSRQSFEVIAGDFLSTRDGKVLHASAISLAVGQSRSGFNLMVQDGNNRFGIDIGNAAIEGPQFAQRRIAEAAVMVHIARAFEIDYRPCIDSEWANPDTYQERVRHYLGLSEVERRRAMQKALIAAGYDPGILDGVWGGRSARALMQYQAAKGLPVTGRPSPELFAMLAGEAERDRRVR